ncbi:MAG: ABC transporter ATP-binding protein, partial [Sediminibacterium sp.]|nr:ABC transporter ATP-binding protein [Sediminibacterium sp.]
FIFKIISDPNIVEMKKFDIKNIETWVIFICRKLNLDKSNIILWSCIMLFVSTVLRGIFMFFMRQTIIVMSRHIEFDQKNQIFKQYLDLDLQFHKNNKIGDLMNRISEDVSKVRMYVGPALMYIINLIITIFFCLYNMFISDWRMTLYVLIPLPILSFIIYKVNSLIHKESMTVQSELSNITSIAQQAFSGIRTIKSFGMEKPVWRHFKNTTKLYKIHTYNLSKVESSFAPTILSLISLSTLIAIIVGAIASIHNQTNISLIIEFIFYLSLLTFPFSAIGFTMVMIQKASASQQRINQFLDEKPKVTNPPFIKKLKLEQPLPIRFNEVSFIYSNKNINALSRINLDVAMGKKLLILGKIGSGKSTIFQLLQRFYDPQEGQILIQNIPINELELEALRTIISYVPQEGFLFNDTIKNNLLIGCTHRENITDKDIQEACNMAVIEQDILQFSQQYQTIVGERGITVSGGQKQRISIARAFLKHAPILVLDDCLSAVDVETEHKICYHINQHFKHQTIFFIAHKIHTQIQFDEIIYLHDGIISERGNHQELMAKEGLYYQLYNKQLLKPDHTQNLNDD